MGTPFDPRHRAPARPDLERLLKEAAAKVDAMSPEEKQAMYDRQIKAAPMNAGEIRRQIAITDREEELRQLDDKYRRRAAVKALGAELGGTAHLSPNNHRKEIFDGCRAGGEVKPIINDPDKGIIVTHPVFMRPLGDFVPAQPFMPRPLRQRLPSEEAFDRRVEEIEQADILSPQPNRHGTPDMPNHRKPTLSVEQKTEQSGGRLPILVVARSPEMAGKLRDVITNPNVVVTHLLGAYPVQRYELVILSYSAKVWRDIRANPRLEKLANEWSKGLSSCVQDKEGVMWL